MASNNKWKKPRPFLTFLVVLLVLLLIAVIVAFFWKLTDGFSNWSWFETDSETVEVEDEGYEEFPDDPDMYSIRDVPEAPVASEDMYEAYVVDFSEEYSPEYIVLSGDVMSGDLMIE